MRNAQGHRHSSLINEMNADGKFLNTSEFVDKLNECLRSVFDDESEVSNRCDESSRQNGPCVPQFELRSRFSDGTTRLLDDTERAYADYKFKLGQAAQSISHLQPHEKLKWAETHRTIGNHLFSQGKYLEAMDVYMTCLVGLDQRTQTQEGATENTVVDSQCILEETKTQTVNQDGESSILDEKIKLPILLNLSACMLKLGMFRKTEKIINLCLETVPCSSTNPKVFYRRGRARAFMGLYNDARSDYNQALGLLSPSTFDKDPSDEIQTIHRAIRKLDQLIENARQNHVKQKKAMRRLLGDQSTQIVQPLDSYDIALVDNHGSPEESFVKAPLYKESSTKTRTYSTLKAFKTSTPSYEKSEVHHDHQDSKVASRIPSIGVKQYFFMILAKIIQFLLSWLGDEPR